MKQINDIFLTSGAQIAYEYELRTVWRKLPKFGKIDFQTACYVIFRILKTDKVFEISVPYCIRKKYGERNFKTKKLKMYHPITYDIISNSISATKRYHEDLRRCSPMGYMPQHAIWMAIYVYFEIHFNLMLGQIFDSLRAS